METSVKTIVIVGGGYAGLEVARILQTKNAKGAKIYLVEGKDDFYHSVGAARCLVDEEFAEKCFISYKSLLKKVEHVKKWVEAIDMERKVISFYNKEGDHDDLKYDYLVIGTGLSYSEPFRYGGRTDLTVSERCFLKQSVNSFRLDSPSTEEILSRMEQQREALKSCKRVVVIGGGAIGVEVASEVKESFPDKEVVLYHSKERLMMGERMMTPHHSAALKLKLEEMGVILHLSHHYNTQQEEQQDNTLVLTATTATPNTSFCPTDILDDQGYVKCDQYMRTQRKDVYAVGDIVANFPCNLKCAKLQHAPIVAENLLRVLHHQAKLKAVKPLAAPINNLMVVTLGTKQSYSVGFMAKLMQTAKQKDCLLEKQKKEMKIL